MQQDAGNLGPISNTGTSMGYQCQHAPRAKSNSRSVTVQGRTSSTTAERHKDQRFNTKVRLKIHLASTSIINARREMHELPLL